jgi:hypothetical protein
MLTDVRLHQPKMADRGCVLIVLLVTWVTVTRAAKTIIHIMADEFVISSFIYPAKRNDNLVLAWVTMTLVTSTMESLSRLISTNTLKRASS